MTSLEPGTRSPAPPPEQVISTLPGSDRRVVRYRVLLHDRHAPPATHPTPREGADEAPRTAKPWRGVVADMPITAWMLLLVIGVLIGYVTAMVITFGIAAGAVVVGIGVVVLIAARGRGLR